VSGQTIMIVAGDPSGDALAAGLMRILSSRLGHARFIGAGGPKMAAAGLESSFDLTADAVIGLSDVLKRLPRFRRYLRQLTNLAAKEKPSLVILVDFNAFNLRLAHAIRKISRGGNWTPKIVKYVSPQVWGTRPGRADKMARDIDLLLCLFPFEKEWYARRTPRLQVECVGHPIFDLGPVKHKEPSVPPLVLLLPGSRRGELKRHLPVVLEAARLVQFTQPVRFQLFVPNEEMAAMARAFPHGPLQLEIQTENLYSALAQASVAISKTGTITLECAYFGVPAVTFYKTSWLTYWVVRSIVQVKYLAMPNLLADKPIYPEFIQGKATPRRLAEAAVGLLASPSRRAEIRAQLRAVMTGWGGPGAAERVADAILRLELVGDSLPEKR
jgi:lipid-A-disaccharide synthase